MVDRVCEFAKENNHWVFILIRQWIKEIAEPLIKPINIIDQILHFTKFRMQKYLHTDLDVTLHNTSDILTKVIKAETHNSNNSNNSMRFGNGNGSIDSNVTFINNDIAKP